MAKQRKYIAHFIGHSTGTRGQTTTYTREVRFSSHANEQDARIEAQELNKANSGEKLGCLFWN